MLQLQKLREGLRVQQHLAACECKKQADICEDNKSANVNVETLTLCDWCALRMMCDDFEWAFKRKLQCENELRFAHFGVHLPIQADRQICQ